MTTANCPRCNETVRLPADELSGDSDAQCPWCGESFPLREILERLPPVLKVVSIGTAAPLATGPSDSAPSDSGNNSVSANWEESAAEPETFAEPSPAADTAPQDDDLLLQEGESSVAETVAFDDFAGDKTVPVTGNDSFVVSDHDGGSVSARARARNPSGGGLRTAIGIIGGGLLAIPIAGAILWAFGLGPFADATPQSRGVVANKPADLASDAWRPSASPSTDTDSSVAADLTNVPAPAVDSQGDAGDSGTMPDSTATAGDDIADSSSAEIVDVQPASPAIGDEVTVIDLDEESVELVATAELAGKMIEALQQYDVDQQKRRGYLTKTYQTVARACDMATTASPSIRQLATAIKESNLLEELGRAGVDWIDYRDRSNDGVLLIGNSDGSSLKLDSGPFINVRGDAELPSTGRALILGHITDPETVTVLWAEPVP